MKVLDTFAGAGGFSLGFQQAGYEIVGAIESDKWACETFKLNHPDAFVIHSAIEDVRDSDLKLRIPVVDVLIGGPPCQGYSVCRKDNGDPKDPRNSLFLEFIRIASLYKPRIILMENVPNLIKAQTKSKRLVIDVIISELEALGYSASARILEATNYGIPQNRRRLFVMATHHSTPLHFPEPTHQAIYGEDNQIAFESGELQKCPTLWDAISDLPVLTAGEGAEIMDYTAGAQNAYQRRMRSGSLAIYNHKAMNHTPRMIERFASMQWGDTGADVPEHLRPYRRNSKVISSSIYDQNNRRMHPYRPCHTIPASFYANFVHPFQNRNFTAREGARLQSFPDSFIFKGKPTVVSHKLLKREGRDEETFLCQYNQIGNAVPPLLSHAFAKQILKNIYANPRSQFDPERSEQHEILVG